MNRKERLENIRNIGIFVDNKRLKIGVTTKIFDYIGILEQIKENGTNYLDWIVGGDCGVTDEDREQMSIDLVQKIDWSNREINFVDVDSEHLFDNQFELTMKLIDGAVSVFSAIERVQPVAKRLWIERIKHGVCSIAFVAHMGKKSADFWGLVRNMEDVLGANLLITQLPIYEGDKLEGMIDLIEMREYSFEVNPNNWILSVDNLEKKPIRNELLTHAKKYQEKMIEQLTLVDGNENFMMKILENKKISKAETLNAIRVATLSMEIVPILFGCLSKLEGTEMLLDAIVEYLPSPLDVPNIEVKELNESKKKVVINPNSDGGVVGFVFYTILDPFRGRCSYVRLYRGSLKSGSSVYNSNLQKEEKVERILKLNTLKTEEVDELFAGEIGAVLLKGTRKGDTLCDSDNRVIFDMNLHSHAFLFFTKIYLTHNESRMESILSERHKNNLDRKIVWNESRRLLTLYASSPAQLNSLVFDFNNKYNTRASTSTTRIVHHETIGKMAQKEYIYTKAPMSNSRAEFAHVCLRVEPQERGKGYMFVDEVKGGVIPKEFIFPINQAIEESLEDGIEKGYPIVDVKVTLYGGNYDDVDSSYKAFQTAGVEAFKEACRLANPILLEPIMKVNIKVDEKYRKAVYSNIVKKDGFPSGNGVTKDSLGDVFIALSKMLDYDRELSVLTNETASYSMEFERFDEVK